MKRITQKEIKRLVALGVAEDITYLSFSTGVYGMNGALFKDESGKLYAITSRTSTLFQMV